MFYFDLKQKPQQGPKRHGHHKYGKNPDFQPRPNAITHGHRRPPLHMGKSSPFYNKVIRKTVYSLNVIKVVKVLVSKIENSKLPTGMVRSDV